MIGHKKRRLIVWDRKSQAHINTDADKSGLFRPTVYHALVIIFLEFFSWGLLMMPIITVLNETFGKDAFLMNGLVQGIKGLLSFLCAPLIGALSDVWGRKPFLLLTVTFTCAPLPLMRISPIWYFSITSLSGVFAVTFSIVFAYVADITTKENRSAAYGLVSATFAASLVISPAIGAYLGSLYGDGLVIALATAVAILDVFFIMVAVPESLSEIRHPEAHHLHISQISWEKADPFGSLRKIGKEKLILMLSLTVFLSYLPEAGEYANFFVYLRLVMHFSSQHLSAFIAMVGILSMISQTLLLSTLMRRFGNKQTVIIGLVFEMIQLYMIGFGSTPWVLWLAGAVAALGSLTYPAISVYVSANASPDQQGVAQGVITGIRGLCNGLGPAMFGVVFYIFNVDLNEHPVPESAASAGIGMVPSATAGNISAGHFPVPESGLLTGLVVPGPPFVFGGFLVIIAMIVAVFMPVSHGIPVIVTDVTPLSTAADEPIQLASQPTVSSTDQLETSNSEEDRLMPSSSEEECV